AVAVAQQHRDGPGFQVRVDHVGAAVAVEVGDGHAVGAAAGRGDVVGAATEGAIAVVQEDGDVAGAVAATAHVRDGQVGVAVAVEVARRHPPRGGARGVGAIEGEGAVAVAEADLHGRVANINLG